MFLSVLKGSICDIVFNRCCLSQIQKKIEEMAALGLDTIALDDEAFNMEAALDRCILRLISSCCNGTRLELCFLPINSALH